MNCSGQPGTPIPSPSIVTGTFNSTNGATLANTFVNYLDNGTGNYTIPTGGFPIAKGSTTCVSGGVTPCTPTTDFTGMARPTPPSLGAYEFAMGPAVTLSPPNLAYGSRLISTSTSLPTTLTNSGGSTLSIASIGITGTNAGDFSQTNTCGPTLAAGANCTITVKFSPTATGARTASVSISDNAPNSPHTVSLTGTGTVSFVQVRSCPSTIQSSNSSIACAFSNAQVHGNLNIVVVQWGDTTSTVSSVTDSTGNPYWLAIGPTSGTGLRQSIYYAKNIAGGSATVTVTFNQAATYPDIIILEYTGLDPSSPLDRTAGAVGTGTSANSGSATTTSANEVIFGAGTTATSFSGAGSGFFPRIINVFGNIAEDKTVASAGTYSATATTGSVNWVMQMATFKAKP